MSDTKTVLVASTKATTLAKLEGLRTSVELAFERAADGRDLLALAWRHAFDLIVIELPIRGLELSGCLKTLRGPACASANSPVVVLGRPDHEAELTRTDEDSPELPTLCATISDVLKVVTDTLDLRARSSVCLLAETERVVDSVRCRQVCQIVNISESGMLLRTSQDLLLTSVLPFSLRLPDDGSLIHGRGEVVRQTDAATEDVSGVGVRFLGLDGDGSSRLQTLLGRGQV